MSEFKSKDLLNSLKDELLVKDREKFAKSTNELVKFLNSKFPDHVRFVAASVRTSLADLTRLNGIYKMKTDREGVVTIELFKNFNQMYMEGDKWFTGFVKKVSDNKDIDTYRQEARDRRKEVEATYSDKKKAPDIDTSVANALKNNPAFKDMMTRHNMRKDAWTDDDKREVDTLLWVHDFVKKLIDNHDVLYSDMPNFNALMSKNYPGDYRILGHQVILSYKEVMAFFKNVLKLKPIIRMSGPRANFEYPSEEEFTSKGVDLRGTDRKWGPKRGEEEEESHVDPKYRRDYSEDPEWDAANKRWMTPDEVAAKAAADKKKKK